MADTISTETTQGAHLPESLLFASEPWTSFYRAGEIIRELHKASEEVRVEPSAPGRPADPRCDEAASSRMDDDGCPTGRTANRLHPHRYSGIGGRLLLVGSPVF